MRYEPKTGINAGEKNREAIKLHLQRDPEATGVEIARALGLSLPTVYGHLKRINEESNKRKINEAMGLKYGSPDSE